MCLVRERERERERIRARRLALLPHLDRLAVISRDTSVSVKHAVKPRGDRMRTILT